MNRAKQGIYIGLGSFFLVLGAIGIFVPLLPTTPFWLLTCWFYFRSSGVLYRRVMRNRYFGTYIRDYMEEKAIPLRSKIISLGVMWTSTLLTSFLLIDQLWIKLVLVAISAGVTWHILSYPTKQDK